MRAILGLILVVGMLQGAPGEIWKPYQFKGNETFVYSIKKVENGEEETGEYTIDFSREGERTVMKLEGRFGDMEGSTTLKIQSSEDIQGQLFAQMFFNPWLAPLSLTLFAQGMMAAMMTAMTAGAEEAEQKYKTEEGTTEYRVENCEFQGKKGKRYVVKQNGNVTYESCVIPGIALPVYIKTVSDEGERYEVRLKDYKEK